MLSPIKLKVRTVEVRKLDVGFEVGNGNEYDCVDD
jgi:hypothetical protein